MPTIKSVSFLPPIPLPWKRVGIYCRVSSNHTEQLMSLANQVSYLTRMVMNQSGWRLCDIYIDIKSAETVSSRKEFERLMDDCRSHKLDMVVTRTISRFGRDTVDLLVAIRELRELGVAVLFDAEMINTSDPDSEFITTVIESFAQAENEARSENTKRGLVMRAANGTSGLYKRRCFGYIIDKNGELQINEPEATIVRSIFEMYLAGESLIGIIRLLEKGNVKTATGKDKWSKSTLDKLLSNEKYCGDVVIFKTYSAFQSSSDRTRKRRTNNGETERFMSISNHPAIISKEVFEAVQNEKAKRSNVEITENGTNRRATHYSKKRDFDKLEN